MANLTTLAAVKADLYPNNPSDITQDDRLNALIAAVSMAFEKACGRALGQATYASVLDGNGLTKMVLPEYPVTAVSSLKVDNTVISARPTGDVTASGWVISNGDVGEIALIGYEFTEGTQNVQVGFTAGYSLSTVPADIEQAVRETVVAKWKKDPNEQLQIASASGEYTQFRSPFVWPPFAYDVIKAYRRPSVG